MNLTDVAHEPHHMPVLPRDEIAGRAVQPGAEARGSRSSRVGVSGGSAARRRRQCGRSPIVCEVS